MNGTAVTKVSLLILCAVVQPVFVSAQTMEQSKQQIYDEIVSNLAQERGEVVWVDPQADPLPLSMRDVETVQLGLRENRDYQLSGKNASDCSTSPALTLNRLRLRLFFLYGDFGNKIASIKHYLQEANLADPFNVTLIKNARKIMSNEALDFRPLTKTLLDYHDKIVETPDWKSKLEGLNLKKPWIDFSGGAKYHEAGFPEPEDACFIAKANGQFRNSQYYEINSDLEAWLYSFWHRRYTEGMFSISYQILLALNGDREVRP